MYVLRHCKIHSLIERGFEPRQEERRFRPAFPAERHAKSSHQCGPFFTQPDPVHTAQLIQQNTRILPLKNHFGAATHRQPGSPYPLAVIGNGSLAQVLRLCGLLGQHGF